MSGMKFSHDGKLLLLSSTNGHIYLFDAFEGMKVKILIVQKHNHILYLAQSQLLHSRTMIHHLLKYLLLTITHAVAWVYCGTWSWWCIIRSILQSRWTVHLVRYYFIPLQCIYMNVWLGGIFHANTRGIQDLEMALFKHGIHQLDIRCSIMVHFSLGTSR